MGRGFTIVTLRCLQTKTGQTLIDKVDKKGANPGAGRVIIDACRIRTYAGKAQKLSESILGSRRNHLAKAPLMNTLPCVANKTEVWCRYILI